MDTNKLIAKIIGYTLLAPGTISVLLFFIDLFTKEKLILLRNLSYKWSGDFDAYAPNFGEHAGGGGGGFSSSLVVYFGLMAIAGAYLIKEKK